VRFAVLQFATIRQPCARILSSLSSLTSPTATATESSKLDFPFNRLKRSGVAERLFAKRNFAPSSSRALSTLSHSTSFSLSLSPSLTHSALGSLDSRLDRAAIAGERAELVAAAKAGCKLQWRRRTSRRLARSAGPSRSRLAARRRRALDGPPNWEAMEGAPELEFEPESEEEEKEEEEEEEEERQREEERERGEANFAQLASAAAAHARPADSCPLAASRKRPARCCCCRRRSRGRPAPTSYVCHRDTLTHRHTGSRAGPTAPVLVLASTRPPRRPQAQRAGRQVQRRQLHKHVVLLGGRSPGAKGRELSPDTWRHSAAERRGFNGYERRLNRPHPHSRA